jgi:hypothetical protein
MNDTGTCRRCADCEGQEHHFGDAYIGTAEESPDHPAAVHGSWYECKHCPAWVLDLDDDHGPCWCGEPNPLFSDVLPDTCGGDGMRYCECGGDGLCVCHWHGAIECNGCVDCEGEGFEDLDYDQYDDAHDDEVDDA